MTMMHQPAVIPSRGDGEGSRNITLMSATQARAFITDTIMAAHQATSSSSVLSGHMRSLAVCAARADGRY